MLNTEYVVASGQRLSIVSGHTWVVQCRFVSSSYISWIGHIGYCYELLEC